VVCLFNIIKYHEGEIRLEQLRMISGTNWQGTTLLGLKQAAVREGFIAEGLRADIEYLKKIDSPVILHVHSKINFKHYIIVYKYHKGKFTIGDPARVLLKWMKKNLLKYGIHAHCSNLNLLDGVFLKSKIIEIK
jgi:ATP-binding cassette, subfamily C, bacteriocin exporter